MPQARRIGVLKDFRQDRPDLEQQYQDEMARVDTERRAIAAGPYPGVGAAHLDLYQMFAWRNWQVIRSGGRSALVLPRGALSGASLGEWRRTILGGGAFESVVFIVNARGWIFDNVHNSYTIGLTVAAKTTDHIVRVAGPFGNEQEFVAGANTLADVPGDEFVSWSSSAAFPLLPDSLSTRNWSGRCPVGVVT